MLHVINTGVGRAEENMRFDAALLDNLKAGSDPILHLYQWEKPSLTYGYFIQPQKHLDLKICDKRNIDLARRSTGGGIVFHIWDLAFSFLMPSGHPAFSQNTLENYRFVNEVVLEVVRTFFNQSVSLISQTAPSRSSDCQNFCMARPTQYDVIHNGMKVAGSAQRKKSQGYLHQGTISLAEPDFSLLEEILVSKDEVIAAMMNYTFAPLKSVNREIREQIEKLLADKLQEALKF